MSNDYTLPPVPSLRLYQRGYERFDMEDYGHACAEHVRAPLLARIAELEADAEIGKRWRENSSLEEWFPITAEEIDRLRAEVEKLRADSVKEVTYTTGHCANNKQPGGCQLHNLQCGWPECDRRDIAARKGEGSEG